MSSQERDYFAYEAGRPVPPPVPTGAAARSLARRLIDLGIPVFPESPSNTGPSAACHATTNKGHIVDWPECWHAGASVATPTGSPSGIVAVQIKEGADWPEEARLRELWCNHVMHTVGGIACLFRCPRPVPPLGGKIAPGVTLLSDGAFIVWGPSCDGTAFASDKLADLPDWICVTESAADPARRFLGPDAESVALALGGDGKASASGWFSACCPCHDDNHPSLGLKDGDRGLIVKCHAGCDPVAVLCRINGLRLPAAHHAPAQNKVSSTNNILRALATWDECEPVKNTPADLYLQTRGIVQYATSKALRYHPNLYNGFVKGAFPALVAAVCDLASGRIRAIHRTFLTANGNKAPIPRKYQKLSLGPTRGGICLLDDPGEPGELYDTVAIAEGIESSASLAMLLGVPAWCAISSGNLKTLALPPEIRTVHIGADHDASGTGQRCARNAAVRWQHDGRKVILYEPKALGWDMNDVLIEQPRKEKQL